MAGKMNLKKPDAQAINIQSYIRVRPLSSKEKKANVLEFGKKEVTIKSGAESSKLNKTLLYDRVFDEQSKQIVIYNAVVKPMIKEVLQGYNCTVFAYGQTGTGKTYTMTGDQDPDACWEESVHAGIVPRAMHDLFHELSIQACEYQVSVSYMELYNERLRSLLKDNEETDLKLIDDLEGGVIVKGLLPTPVKSKEEVFKLLQHGAEKRQVAATQMNLNSSRSHTIFTINVNIKESAVAGKDDVLRCGKLHLVDLAGSENVSKSGASENIHKSATGVNKRLAEASNINKSLLTLGRVITCLTENNPHIPYRESKLTRFLQDSLGGKTKTCIIGTISPAQANLDETESTLNYASKARSIKNKPVRNQTISKKDFMQVASEEIMKLKKDLEAVRQGEGFYISKESHEEMISRMKELDDQVKDSHEKYSRIKESYEQSKEMFSSLSSDFDDKCAEYEELDNLFRIESQRCQEKMKEFAKEVVVREYFIKEYEKTEGSLTEQAKTCKSVLENLLDQSNRLHDKIDRKQSNESDNLQMLGRYKENASKKVADFKSKLDSFLDEEKQFVKEVIKNASTVNRLFEEENHNVLSTIKSFEHQMKALAQSRNETLHNKQTEFTGQVNSCKSRGEEIIQHSVNLYKDVIKSHILPSMKNIQDQLNLITKITEEGSNNLARFETRQKKISEITENHVSLMQFSTKIVDQVEAIRRKNKEVVAKPIIINNLVDQFNKNIKQVMSILTAAQGSCASIKSESASVLAGATATEEGAESLKETAMSNLQILGSIQSNVEEVKTVSEQQSEQEKTLSSEIKENVDSLVNEVNTHVEHIENGVKQNIEQVQVLCGKQQQNLSRLENSVSVFTEQVSQTVVASESKVENLVEQITDKLIENETRFEKTLREQNNVARTKLQNMNEKPELSQVVQALEENLKSISYKQYVPQGSTPQRISKDQLQYPRKFVATAPRMELVRKLREKYPEAESVPNENLNFKEYLPADPFFNGDIPVTTEKSTGSIGSTGDRRTDSSTHSTPRAGSGLGRRSTSMPDLNVTDDVFVVPSPVDNKENMRTRSARRPTKSKIPDLAIPKKKNILGPAQNFA
ncbi:kinesin-like protein Klp61F isoform X1 [Macrosteles quadrilineatus]|uniref:kinesin-like protein Klp61F isoform X1 n=1 Tax=Macrosteles quadrilineatus TaxID=74068 RepID=UPI0023E0B366|nr:kinesin-like protein Klp61F isoform X1 [Macrosteles quadrilineatus]XP_054263797.1 kinesin-like protein Klp61F isoform X1 [Macrosteles quadrilineatus]XP_054263806.1 kinesin-like protein Klp61F isoform X1 [Macrosteles quadrilineatus]